jgi:hypothetical protein
MGSKTGLVVGLAVGYYYGAKAGRQRYEQIERYLRPVRESDAWHRTQELGKGLVEELLVATRQAVKDATAPDSNVTPIRRAG